MGQINYLAVVLAAVAFFAVGAVWYTVLFGKAWQRAAGLSDAQLRGANMALIYGLAFLCELIIAWIIGHMFARIGEETLAAKPWLYFMMSGGLAIAFVIPALWISFSHIRVATRVALIDAGYWLVAYLAMGLVFYLFG